MDLPVVVHSEHKRPSLKADAISKLIQSSSGQEQALYVLLAATGMRVRKHWRLKPGISQMTGEPSLSNFK
jgi:hypothetical protein